MLKHVYLIFISTFLLGLIAGAILFLSSNMGTEEDGLIEEGAAGYAVAVYGYGGCTLIGCPSYRLTQDGSYIFIASNGQRYTGTIPFDERRKIGDALQDVSLTEVNASAFEGQCPIVYDGTAYRYDITYRGSEYHLDSCAHAVEGVPLFTMLDEYLVILAERHSE